jgi:LysR family transcriptional regulator, cyn operon transcriptional activator
MELRQLKYFLKAKALLNFTEAANSLHISQSTLSQQIKQLEEELNMPLFNRIGKRITLTEAGVLFAEYALQSVNKANDGALLLKDLNSLDTGKITVGVTYGLRNHFTIALLQFIQKYPKIKIQIVFGTSKELLEKLSQTGLDFILTLHEAAKEAHLHYQKLFTAPLALVVSKNSKLARKPAFTLNEICELPLVLPSKGYSTRQLIDRLFEQIDARPNIAIEINDIPTLLEIVRIGYYNTILAQTTVDSKDSLITIPMKGKNMIVTAMIISLRDAYKKKSVREFYEILKEVKG